MSVMDRYDRILNFRNRCRFALKGVHKLSGWAILLAPIVFVYLFCEEPKYWRRHCEYMQERLDYERERKSGYIIN